MSRIDHVGPRTRAAIDDKVMRSGGKKTRYEKLFGTPERAARTMAGITCDDGGCEGCTLYGANCSYDASRLLEWLRGDAESGIDYGGSRTKSEIEDEIMRSSGKRSNYDKLFGTPEGAARTLETVADRLSAWTSDNITLTDMTCALVSNCDECIAQDLPVRSDFTKCGKVDLDVLLRWLSSDADLDGTLTVGCLTPEQVISSTLGSNENRIFKQDTLESILREFTEEALKWACQSGFASERTSWMEMSSEYIERIRKVMEK